MKSYGDRPGAESQNGSIDLILEERTGDDRVTVLSFGQLVAMERAPEVGPFAGFAHQVGCNASNLGEAVDGGDVFEE